MSSIIIGSDDRVRSSGPIERLAVWVQFLDGWRRAVVAMLSGAICVLALPPFNFPAVGFIGFPIFVWLLDGAAGDPRRSLVRQIAPAFAVGWFFGFGYFVAGLWWLGTAMLVDAAEFAVFIPFAVVGLPAILGIYYGLAAVLARRIWSDSAWRIFSMAAALALAEALRGVLFTGFPWNEIGVMAAPVPLLMQTVSLIGVHGLTLLAMIVFSAPAVVPDRRGRAPVLLIAGFLLLGHIGFGAWRLATHPTEFVDGVNVRVVQPNIEQSQSWSEAQAQKIFDRHMRLSAQRADPASIVGAGLTGARTPTAAAEGAGQASSRPPITEPTRTLIVWPESSVPFLLTERADAIERIADMLQPGETLIAGAARVEGSDMSTARFYNSVYVINDEGEIVDARDKLHLVPFGEYMPFRSLFDRLGIAAIAQTLGGFSPGAVRSKVTLPGAPSFLPLICYEIIFPWEIDVATPQSRPGFLVNDTNDAWYGDTPGPYQHLRLAELTATAFALPLVRSANTGISVVTDPYGREVGALALGSAGTIETALPDRGSATLYARYADLPFWIAFAIVLICGCVARLRIRPLID